MLRITFDVQTLPNGATALDLRLVGLTERHTANEIEMGSQFFEHVATLAATMADRSNGKISFTPVGAVPLELAIPVTTLCSCAHDTVLRSR